VAKIDDAVSARDAQALVIQGRFLAEKFGSGDLVSPGAGAAAPTNPTPAISTPATTLDLG